MAFDAAQSRIEAGRRIRARKHLRAAPTPPRSPEAPFDREYWIAHCEGYRVDGHEGRIGFVDEIRANPADPTKPLLAIRAGMLGRHILVVPADEVEAIAPRSQRIQLRSPIAIVQSDAAA